MVKGETRAPINVILLSIITCGIYLFVWYYKVIKEINAALGREAISMTMFIVSIFCFPVTLYIMYLIDQGLVEIGAKSGVPYSTGFIMWLVLSFVGVGSFLMMFQVQTYLNSVWAKD